MPANAQDCRNESKTENGFSVRELKRVCTGALLPSAKKQKKPNSFSDYYCLVRVTEVLKLAQIVSESHNQF
jgi:hypothetical protein